MTTSCPTQDELRRLMTGRLPPSDADRLAAHIEACPTCVARIVAEQAQAAPEFGPRDSDPDREAENTADIDALVERVRKAVVVSSGGLPEGQTIDVGSAGSSGPAESPGTTIAGRYALVEPIGEGGMGTVWIARQTEPVKRLVAIKLIKAGMDSRAVLKRFEAERQALALMDHPNIARVLDGGVTALGRPFFVMELVRGLPLTRFCDENKLRINERLDLFVSICQAVQHAHQ